MEDGAAPNVTMIRDLPAAERPRERLRDYGAGALSNIELIAILLRTGNTRQSAIQQAQDLLAHFDGLTGLARAPFRALCAERGLGEAKAAQLKAALELGIRAAAKAPLDRRIYSTPEDVADLFVGEMSLLEQEEVRVIVLDARNHLVGIHKLYKGSMHTTSVRIGELLREPVRLGASAMVLVHNHPSGDAVPSAHDIRMTKALVEAGRLLDIELADHIVVGGGSYVSMRGARLGFADAG
jgi:DNA repair protein RadC